MKKIISLFSLLVLTFITSCAVQKNIGNHNFNVQCLGNSLDGSLSLRSWGTGKEISSAIEDAKKKALNEIIFSGIKNGSTECSIIPLVLDVNAKTNHEEFFINFYSNPDNYNQFIFVTEDNITKARKSKIKINSANGIAHIIDVNVKKFELKKYLKSKGIK